MYGAEVSRYLEFGTEPWRHLETSTEAWRSLASSSEASRHQGHAEKPGVWRRVTERCRCCLLLELELRGFRQAAFELLGTQ